MWASSVVGKKYLPTKTLIITKCMQTLLNVRLCSLNIVIICNIDWPQQIVSLTIKVRIFIHVEDEKVTALNRTHFFSCYVSFVKLPWWVTICDKHPNIGWFVTWHLPAPAWQLKQSLFIVTEVRFVQDILWHEIIPVHYGLGRNLNQNEETLRQESCINS